MRFAPSPVHCSLELEITNLDHAVFSIMLVYHFLKQEHGLDTLRKRRLKVSFANDLNDPFEHLAIELSDGELRSAMRRALSDQAQIHGLICFSESWRSPVMWSHYAERHSGVCLGFEIPDECLSEVRYQDARIEYDPEVLESDPEAAKVLMRRLAITKFSDWSYETEWRAFVSLSETTQENNLRFLPFSEQLQIKRIIVGHHSSISRQQIANVIEDHNPRPECFKARPAFTSFQMTRQKNNRLWK
jgi:hypothetical protein